jgi:hypothetical protein
MHTPLRHDALLQRNLAEFAARLALPINRLLG